ncbi:hypothetical protein TanjilG_16517 [Lupinus angustifolius]|uniref:PARP catalytic domain-containing protein n=1 Tax=Lupinus angustifolius TaxID=3871 RepID=A0A1J7IR96_LUPAN|nr:hypothetical protein TanjilG_16517 [Lupinus angustifolius]
MSKVWHSLKKSLHCKPHSTEVHDPSRTRHHNRSDQRKKHSKESHSKQGIPLSQGSSDVLNLVTHEIVLDTLTGENKFCSCPFPQNNEDASKGVESSYGSTRKTIISDTTHYVDFDDKYDTSTEHSAIQLHKEDSSWQIIEKICQPSYTNSESKVTEIQCVLKVLNHQKTFASFEECREVAMTYAEKLQDNKLSRFLANGNELLRFHGTTIACSLGMNNGSSNKLCTFDQCGLCHILRHGFSTKNQDFDGVVGILTTSTSEKAFYSVGSYEKMPLRKCVIVCRVIAGRIHNPLQENQEMITDSGFDSLVKKISAESDIEELHILNPRAILPCFVVIYKL